MFRDKTGGGFQYDDHEKLTLNIFNWLISDYRMELTKQGEEHTLPVSIKPAQPIEDTSSTVEPATQIAPGITAETPIKFTSKAEVIEILNNYLSQINTMKTSINKLIEIISDSAEEIFREPEVQEIQKVSTTNPDFIYEPYEEDEQPKHDYFGLQEPKDLTALPPRPAELKSKELEESEDSFIKPVPTAPSLISEPPKHPKESTENQKKTKASKKKKTPKVEKKEENKEELKAELDSLESKLNSVLNLIKFIEKKHEDGKLDDKTYDKQTQKLQKDLDQTKKRISEIKKSLE
jgi:hypothetical protein